MKNMFLLMLFPLSAFATTFSTNDFIGKWRDSGIVSNENLPCNVEIIKQHNSDNKTSIIASSGNCGNNKTEKLFDFKIESTSGVFSAHQTIIDNHTKQLLLSRTITGNMSKDKNNIIYNKNSNLSRFILAK